MIIALSGLFFLLLVIASRFDRLIVAGGRSRKKLLDVGYMSFFGVASKGFKFYLAMFGYLNDIFCTNVSLPVFLILSQNIG